MQHCTRLSEQAEYYDYSLYAVIKNYSGLLVCTAGNGGEDYIGDNIDTVSVFPASYGFSNIISVGASNSINQITSFSNYGASKVDVFAPGENITTTNNNGSIISVARTSFVAPYVAGVAALLLSVYPDLLPCEIKATINNSVDDCGTNFDGQCVSEGRLKAYNALTNVVRHDISYTNNTTQHTVTYNDCNYAQTSPHYYEISPYNSQKHIVVCKYCDYTYFEIHTWNSSTNQCLDCGYSQ